MRVQTLQVDKKAVADLLAAMKYPVHVRVINGKLVVKNITTTKKYSPILSAL